MSDAARVAAALGAAPPVGHDADLRERAEYHGVWPLVAGGAGALRDVAAVELLRKRELLEVLRALDDAGVAPLLLKGAALAYSIYPSPVLRPRADTDLLIPDDDRERLEQALLAHHAFSHRDPRAQFARIVWLDQIVGGAQAETLHLVIGRPPGRYDDDV